MSKAIQAEPLSEEKIKLLILGDSGVGKSSLMMRFTSQVFTSHMMGTTGIDMRVKDLILDNKLIKVNIWDTAGQERFRSIARTYYNGAHGIILAYDVNDKTSFTNIPLWLEDIKKHTSYVHILLVGNKIDLRSVVPEGDARQFAITHNIPFILTSAKTDENVQEAFLQLIKTILDSGIVKKQEKRTLSNRNAGDKKGCCN
jgi:Ras-related protein Rab-1A